MINKYLSRGFACLILHFLTIYSNAFNMIKLNYYTYTDILQTLSNKSCLISDMVMNIYNMNRFLLQYSLFLQNRAQIQSHASFVYILLVCRTEEPDKRRNCMSIFNWYENEMFLHEC